MKGNDEKVIKLYDNGVYLVNGKDIITSEEELTAKTGKSISVQEASKNTMAYSIMEKHNVSGNMDKLQIKFDAMASHDITYVGIIQTAMASGLEKFPIPYVLTNCHNTLCAVGGTINEDDHMYGLSAAKKFGGIFVPGHQAVIHSYMREMMSGGGKMIIGSDSHTRYGALGTMAVGEGGPELVKQLLNRTYDIDRPEVVAVYLTGTPAKGVGPQDVALAIIGAVFENGYVKNKVMEFVGDGVNGLSVDFRCGIDVMTTETTCLSSIWITDNKVEQYYEIHGRKESYKELAPKEIAYYNGMVYVDLSKVKPMIAMPFHPSNVYTIEDLNKNLFDIIDKVEQTAKKQLDNSKIKFTLKDKIKDGRLYVEQGVIAGCAGGTYENLCDAADIIGTGSVGNGEFSLSVYPGSQPIFMQLMKNGVMSKYAAAGAVIRSSFCGPCFGAGDVPSNNGLSIRHTTRNFPNREGSKPGNGQIASVALMDARSIAATALNKGKLTPATDIDVNFTKPKYFFDSAVYSNRVYNGYQNADSSVDIKYGPNIVPWPKMSELTENIVLKVASVITDPVTTTDELIPSGETSSYRSNPLGLAEFTLSRKDPAYVGQAKQIQLSEKARLNGEDPLAVNEDYKRAFELINKRFNIDVMKTGVGSLVYAVKPGDGSAREQAASCQKVLGGWANIAVEYATKRYRSNLINWGMLPLLFKKDIPFEKGDFIFIPNIRKAIADKASKITAYVVADDIKEFTLEMAALTDDERQIILSGCLINFYQQSK